MGNAPFTVGIHIHNNENSNEGPPQVVAGGTLEGRVYLEVTGGSQRASSLNVRLVGTETTTVTRFKRSKRTNATRYKNRSTKRESHTLVDVDVPLVKFGSGTVRRGRYEYPFRLELPSNLPSSFLETASGVRRRKRKGKETKGQIRYTLEAGLRAPNGFLPPFLGGGTSKQTTRQKYRGSYHKQDVIIVSSGRRVPEENLPVARVHSGVVKTPMKRLYCLPGGGNFLHSLQVKRGVVSPGDAMDMTLLCRNESRVALREIQLDFQEVTTLRTRGGNRATSIKTLWTCTLENVPELGVRDTPLPQLEEHAAPSLADMPNRGLAFTVPSHARDSYRGHLIQVQHRVVARFLPPPGAIMPTTKPQSTLYVNVVRGGGLSSSHKSERRPSFERNETVEPSAPPLPQEEPYQQAFIPVAVPVYDKNRDSDDDDDDDDDADFEQHLPVASEAALPDDWTAITAEVVTVSMRDAAGNMHVL